MLINVAVKDLAMLEAFPNIFYNKHSLPIYTLWETNRDYLFKNTMSDYVRFGFPKYLGKPRLLSRVHAKKSPKIKARKPKARKPILYKYIAIHPSVRVKYALNFPRFFCAEAP